MTGSRSLLAVREGGLANAILAWSHGSLNKDPRSSRKSGPPRLKMQYPPSH